MCTVRRQRCPIRDQRKAGANTSVIRALFFKKTMCAASVRLGLGTGAACYPRWHPPHSASSRRSRFGLPAVFGPSDPKPTIAEGDQILICFILVAIVTGQLADSWICNTPPLSHPFQITVQDYRITSIMSAERHGVVVLIE